MRVLQVSPTKGEHCGVALFGERLATELEAQGIGVTTVPGLDGPTDADVVLIQHHAELLDDAGVRAIGSRAGRPVVLFAHSTGIEGLLEAVDGVMAMSSGMVPETGTATLVFPHPARTPERLSDRSALRARFGLPLQDRILGTCGFLRFERQLVEILSALLPRVAGAGGLVQVMTSPWYIDSPGLVEEIAAVGRRYPGHFVHEHRHLPEEELNLRLQACDLLWCWTRASSQPYASGVASELYASGSRVVAADKLQHEQILRLPNVVRAPAVLDAFVAEVTRQVQEGEDGRHNPSPVSWDRHIRAIARFLHDVALSWSTRTGEAAMS